jgi:hypothetical protein
MAEDLRKLFTDQTNAIGDSKRVIINYKKLSKASVTLPKIRSHLANLQTLSKKVRRLHNDITFAATTEDRRKLLHFVEED